MALKNLVSWNLSPSAACGAADNIPENDEARCFVLLGYCDGAYPAEKARKAGRSTIIEG